MTGIGYFQNLQAIHFISSSSQRQNKPKAFCVLFCCGTMDVGQGGVWWGAVSGTTTGCAQGMLTSVNRQGKRPKLRDVWEKQTISYSIRLEKFLSSSSALFIVVWWWKKLCLIMASKVTKTMLWRLSFNYVTTCTVHEHEVSPEKLNYLIS